VARTKQAKHDLTWDEMVDKGYVVIGSPDTVREKLEEAAKALNIGHLCAMLQFGNMRDELVRWNTKLFADKVAPALRSLFSEHTDQWWPTGAQ
jgi:alkanesulfonate monooxygenase SsuD/methylene tetrahydromethanopterin reductase-like flavin-dependent oxidoreductase (luciferase family)